VIAPAHLHYLRPGAQQSSRWLHRAALVTTAATFPLIFLGGMVTSKHAGLSVPDWPNSYGYNMFTFPPSRWVGGIFFEHTHRLLGSLVGLLSIILTVMAFRTEPRRSVRWLAAAVLGAVIVQGILGGLRVVLVNLNLAMAHGCLAQICFCLAAVLCVVTSRQWFGAADALVAPGSVWPSRLPMRLASIAVLCVIVQLVLGAVMRHEQAGLAIPDFPLSYGALLPPTSQAQLDATLAQWSPALQREGLTPPTLFQVWIHFAHRAWAMVGVAAVLGLAINVLLRHRRTARGWLVRPAVAMIALLVAQVTLGISTVLMGKPADVATAHLAVGALVLLSTVVLMIRIERLHYVIMSGQCHRPVKALARPSHRARSEPAVAAGAASS
jgi:cytochrome c oxidase assembly protein subunit 15